MQKVQQHARTQTRHDSQPSFHHYLALDLLCLLSKSHSTLNYHPYEAHEVSGDKIQGGG